MSTDMPPGGSSERPEPEGLVSDEQWAELVRQAERGGAGAPKEPSARARMVTARLRALDEQAAQAQGRGRPWGRKQAQPWQPEGWRTGPDPRYANGRSRKRKFTAVLGFLVVLGACVVAMRPSLVTGHLPGGGDDGSGQDRPTLAQPFQGSPAVSWADGAAGIELPEAEAVGGMSEDEVGQALRATRQLLIAANLDPATLRGEKPDRALELLDPLQKGEPERLERSLAEPSEEQDPLMLFSRFDPAETQLVGEVVKTRGEMTFEAGDAGSVEVHADYTFVYPLVRPGGDEVARTIARRRLTTVLHDPEKFEATRGKLSILTSEQNFGNTACEVNDGFLHPSFPSDTPAPGPRGDEVDPYDRGAWQPDGPCGTLERS
ncbi:hypothetical protein ACIRD8_08060 [Streptomyces sp. NPDC102451]|uniref:hypothetical protein n=1 Tax=Streptomyces sp. NPDC102451 TaxID=3366177 RepID=UPI0038169AAA